MSIHPTAIIEEGAALGTNVSVGPFAVIQRDTRIEDGCVIGPHAVIYRHTSLGPGCQVHAHAVLGDVPQDLAFKENVSYVRIGARCTLREGVTIHRGTKPETATVVGDDCFLMANSHLGHNVQLGNGVIMANGVLLAGYVTVGDRAFLSGNVVVHQFGRIGRLAMVSGGAALSKDVPPFCTVPSVSRNRIVGMNVVGMRRAQMGPADRKAVKAAFQILFRSGLNTSAAVARIQAEFASGPGRELGDFVAASKRGICRFVGTDDEEGLDE
jgi:UDP-N-acetylglucosamine acyltransferase